MEGSYQVDGSATRPATSGVAAAPDVVCKRLRCAFDAAPFPDANLREQRLDRLIQAVECNQERIVEAVSADFGHRARMETLFGEVVATISAARHARRHLRRWMRRRPVATPLHMKPGRSFLVPQPLGVVGILSPWNYPFFLALSPLAPALASGNRVIIKPSEVTPRSSALLAEMVDEAFHSDEVVVVTGGAEVGAACAALPLDHLLFTGSTAVGRKIAAVAASNLTPVTLELGGKSPAIIDASADLAKTARSIVFGKAFNAGQTCVAPDYVLAPRSRLDAVVDALRVAAAQMYPEMARTGDYSAIVSDRHFERLCALVDEARAAGVGVMQMADAAAMTPQRKLPLTLILNPPRSLRVMQEEIFGPILPVIAYDTEQDAIDYVNAGERPLALYWFGRDRAARDRVLERTVAGGVTINDTNWHVVQENLPFGGVGASGHGVYHGVAGFETFSNMKAVFAQSRFANTAVLQPPFGPRSERVLGLLRRFI